MACFPPDPTGTLPPEAAREGLLLYAEVQAVLRALPAGHADPVAFDLDDTIVTGFSRTTRRPEDVPDTRHAVAWVLGRLLEEGRAVVIVTGREDEEEAWADLVRALEEVCGRPVDPSLLQQVVVSCGGAWSGTRVAVERKVRALRTTKAALLVGDLDHLDGKAARRAGIPFVDVGPKHTSRRLGG